MKNTHISGADKIRTYLVLEGDNAHVGNLTVCTYIGLNGFTF